MTAGDAARRYLQQRISLGEDKLFLDHAAHTTTASSPESVVSAVSAESVASAEPTTSAEPALPAEPAAPAPPAVPTWRKDAPAVPGPGIVIPPPDRNLFEADPLGDLTLEALAEVVRTCTRCSLCRTRTNAVPGEGPKDARLMVIGEGPGATEDETGRPFVGRAGKLLDDILDAIDLPRPQVFIANIVKCRPPNNRNPEADEVNACVPFLHRQIALIQPSAILALGGVAATTLLNSRGSLGSLRNRVHDYMGIPLVVTYHPAALLRNPHWKKPTWDDVRIARRIVAGDR